jgi:hypothetical protein
MDGRLIFLHQTCGQTERRFLESDRPIRSGRPARARAYTIPKSLEGESRKTSGRMKQAARTKTDTGRRDEYSQALERTLVKELCNMAP